MALQPCIFANDRPRRRTILLVEDEPFVREATCSILERAGFEVLPAGDAREAMQVYEQCQRAIEGRSGVVASQRQPAVRGETQTERGGVHVATLQLSRTKRGQTPSSGWIRQSGRPGSSQP